MTFDDLEPLKEATSPDAIMSSGMGIFLLLSGIILLLALVALVKTIVTQRKKQIQHKLLAPLDKAVEELTSLKNSDPDTKTAAIQSSFIFRELLNEETGDKALYETHEEFSVRPDALYNIPASLREETRHYLLKLARLKYVPANDRSEAQPLIDTALNLIKSIIHKIREDESHKKNHPSRPNSSY